MSLPSAHLNKNNSTGVRIIYIAYIIIYVCMYMYMCVCMYMHSCIFINTHVCVYIYSHMYLHTHIHTYTQRKRFATASQSGKDA